MEYTFQVKTFLKGKDIVNRNITNINNNLLYIIKLNYAKKEMIINKTINLEIKFLYLFQ